VNVTFSVVPIAEIQADALIMLAFEDGPPHPATAALYESGEFKGKPGDLTLLHSPAGMQAKRLALTGCGKRDAFKAPDARKAAGAAIRSLKGKNLKSIAIFAPGEFVQAVTEGLILGEFEPDELKTSAEKHEGRIETAAICSTDDAKAAFESGRIIAESQNFTRALVNEPGNRLPPRQLAARAQAMAAEAGLDCEVLDQDRMMQLGMGALLGVGVGSSEPPVMIVVRYKPEKPAPGGVHLGLIGKGVTFDTGGISIKPADGMEKMKYDMAGGAAVLGAIRALAKLKPSIPVTAVVPAAENMPGSRAQRPGDIVTSLNGKTVEVLNTDAEGRMILIDAITYAQKHLGCTHFVDAATLTGAIVVALGHVHIGGFANNDEFFARVDAATKAQGERMWRMPLDDDYKEQLKSAFADLQNIGGRWGGAITAAYFLKEFADPTPWVHLDIAGTAWLDDAKPHLAKGPTGVAVRTFVDLAMNWK
jgi:leucyl aminopeptidase